jgi:glyoxylase I family protein
MVVVAGGVHHVTLTVTNPARSKEFYTSVLGVNHVMDLGEKVIMGNDSLLLIINPPPDKSQAIANDSFSEHRCGLDHVSFNVASLSVLEEAVRMFDEKGIPHGEIKDLSGAGVPIYVLAFRDPDNIQLEFTAPKQG